MRITKDIKIFLSLSILVLKICVLCTYMFESIDAFELQLLKKIKLYL